MHMYNRYIPQPDGSFRRNAVPEPKVPESRSRSHVSSIRKVEPHSPSPEHFGFFKRLLPGNFDSSDWIIVLLLLLMSGDKPEDRSHMLMTLALYLMM